MKNLFRLIIPALLSITLYGCDDRDASHQKRQLKIVSQIELSQRPGYWIYKEIGYSNRFERVALIYGFAYDGNKIFCEDVIASYMKKYPGSSYKCAISE